MRLINIIFFMLFYGFCASASANSQIEVNLVKSLVVHDFGDSIHLITEAPFSSVEGCRKNNVLIIMKTHPSFKEIYAAILMIYQSNGRFSAWVNGCSSAHIAPLLTRLDLVK